MSHAEQAKYSTDLSDGQWRILRKLLPQPSHRGAPQKVCRRAVVDAVLYVLRSGCAWRLLPREFPKWKTVYGIFRDWRNNGTWQRIHDSLRDGVFPTKVRKLSQRFRDLPYSQGVTTNRRRRVGAALRLQDLGDSFRLEFEECQSVSEA